MITQEFQVEPANRLRADAPAVRAGAAADTGAEDADAIALLLALELRGRLNDCDRDLLDRLTPERHISFVVRGSRFLHPEGVELFPLSVIEPAFAHQGQALFAHHWQKCDKGDKRHCTIHTAVLRVAAEPPFVLGILGPDSGSAAQRAADLYAGTIGRIRSLQENLRDILRRAEDHLAGDRPALVVNRDTGRVVAVNRAAETLLDRSETALINCPFSALSERPASPVRRTRISLVNLDHTNLRLALVTLEAGEEGDPAAPDDPFVADFFVHRLRRRLSNIMISTSLLQAQNEHRLRPDEQALLHGILAQAQKANSYLSEMNLLLNYEALPACESGLMTEIEHAVELAREELPHEIEAEISGPTEPAVVTAPKGIHLRLLRAALLAHAAGETDTCRCRIAAEKTNGDTLSIAITSTTPSDLTANSDRTAWRGLAERLAERAGVGYAPPPNGPGTLRSVLEMKCNHKEDRS